MLKSTKSYSKRIKLTRTGKIIARKPGQNHFNAKERSRASNSKHQSQRIHMNNKSRSRFLVNM